MPKGSDFPGLVISAWESDRRIRNEPLGWPRRMLIVYGPVAFICCTLENSARLFAVVSIRWSEATTLAAFSGEPS